MSDDTDLTRLFAQAADLPADEAFVESVTARIAWRRRLTWLIPAAIAAVLVLAIWTTWPAAYTFSDNALSGIMLIAGSLRGFAGSDAGTLAATVLVLTTVFWSWLFEWVRERRI